MKRLSDPFAVLIARMQGVRLGKGTRFFGMPVVVRSKNAVMEIGEKFTLSSGFLSNLVGMYQRSILFARGKGKLRIGDRVGMSGVTVYAFDSITIGDDVIVGANTKILDSDMHPVDPAARLANKNDRARTGTAPIEIGNNVFIGCNCLILKGTRIGSNCTVGAGSVVCGRFEDNCIIAGNPARVIRKLGDGKENDG